MLTEVRVNVPVSLHQYEKFEEMADTAALRNLVIFSDVEGNLIIRANITDDEAVAFKLAIHIVPQQN